MSILSLSGRGQKCLPRGAHLSRKCFSGNEKGTALRRERSRLACAFLT